VFADTLLQIVTDPSNDTTLSPVYQEEQVTVRLRAGGVCARMMLRRSQVSDDLDTRIIVLAVFVAAVPVLTLVYLLIGCVRGCLVCMCGCRRTKRTRARRCWLQHNNPITDYELHQRHYVTLALCTRLRLIVLCSQSRECAQQTYLCASFARSCSQPPAFGSSTWPSSNPRCDIAYIRDTR
jgi:hypothetical protein